LRLIDIPARFDKQTFAVLAPATDIHGATQALTRQQAGLSEQDQQMMVTLSVGIAAWEPGMDSGQILDLAFRHMQTLSRY